jgi:hypothetical protein
MQNIAAAKLRLLNIFILQNAFSQVGKIKDHFFIK